MAHRSPYSPRGATVRPAAVAVAVATPKEDRFAELFDEIERSYDEAERQASTPKWADPNIREVVMPRRMRDTSESDPGDVRAATAGTGVGSGASYHVAQLLKQVAEVEATLGPEKALAKRFTFDDPNPYTKGTRVYYIEEAEREARESLTQWALSQAYTPEELVRLRGTKSKLLAVVEDLVLALNDRVLALALVSHVSDLSPHADVMRALKAALPSLKGVVHVAQAALPSPELDALTRGAAILKAGFQWHQEALRQLKAHLERPETMSDELAPLIGTLKVYTTNLLSTS